MKEPRTLLDLFYASVALGKSGHLRAKRDGVWQDISSEDYRRTVEELAMGLLALGIEKGDRIAILSENRPEWAFADLASLAIGAIDVPIYPNLTSEQALYLLNDSESKAVFVSDPEQAAKVAETRGRAPTLEHVIRMQEGSFPPGTIGLGEVCEKGRAALRDSPEAVRERAALVEPDDLATIIYTSGTTGKPKGVMLTHSNLVSNVVASHKILPVGPESVVLSFLPLCHVFERMAGHYMMLKAGATIAYAESIDKVAQNMIEVRPTVMASVPRLYEKMRLRILEKVATAPPLRQKLFHWAIDVGRQMLRHHVEKTQPPLTLKLKHAVAGALVYKKIAQRVGGRLETFVSGGAPLPQEIAEFFAAAGLVILEGYGLTETSPVICVNRPDDYKPGTVGPPIEDVEVKIAADGEILSRGPHIMKGYYKNPEATAEVIDADGWFHTGDIGELDERNFLRITDRKKDIIITSGGKNIAPQPIESRLKRNPLVGEIVVVGNRRNYPAAVIVPAFENLEAWARKEGVPSGKRSALIASPEVKALYDGIVDEANGMCAQYEKIKRVSLIDQEFSIATGELTPTMKVKRRVVEEKFKDVIDAMYAS